MVEGWSMEEAIEFCTYYLDIKKVGVLESRHEGRLTSKETIGEKSITVDDPINHPSTMPPSDMNLFLTYLLKTFINLSKGNI